MRAFFAAIRAALSKLKRMIWVTVEIAGELVSVLRPAPEFAQEDTVDDSSGYEAASPAQAPAARQQNELDRIRALATDLACNPSMSPTEILARGVGPMTAAWLSSMSQVMLCRVALASDQSLADAIAGRRSLKGVYDYDAFAPNQKPASTVYAEARELENDAGLDRAFAM